MNKIILKVVCFATVLMLSACSGRFYTIPTAEYDKSEYTVVATDSVTSTGIHLFGCIPINLNNKFERAVEQLKTRNGGDAVTDISVQERWFWAYVLNGYKTQVNATVLKKK